MIESRYVWLGMNLKINAESGTKIISRVLSDLEYVQLLKGHLGTIVTSAYIKSLAYTHGKCSYLDTVLKFGGLLMFPSGLSLFGSIVALVAAFCIKEHRL